ncbi:MAG: ATP-grasp domain-containing protein [Halioglobus sp.]|nr:ATP-grasp domain-containing protein [Halioglobus sp.]
MVEPALDDMLEIAVLVVSDGAGELRAYPPVGMEFDARWNAVSLVGLPAALDDTTAGRCEGVARDAVGALGAAGVFAVELFVTPEQSIYINEISPRVHNSGHLTLEAFEVGQFEQHVRAVMGLPLAPVNPRARAAVMLNLLYDDSMSGALGTGPGIVDLDDRGHTRLYWYGKTAARPGRKMGHITAIDETFDAARERVLSALAACDWNDPGLLEGPCRAMAS